MGGEQSDSLPPLCASWVQRPADNNCGDDNEEEKKRRFMVECVWKEQQDILSCVPVGRGTGGLVPIAPCDLCQTTTEYNSRG